MNVLLASLTRRTRQVLDFIPSWGISVQKAFLAVTMPKKEPLSYPRADSPTEGQIPSADSQAFLIYIRLRTKTSQKHIGDVETYSRCIKSCF